VLSGLAPTGVPVPGTIVLCQDPEILGAPFYVMEHVDGIVYRTPESAAGLGSDRAVATAHALIDVLADLHEVAPASAGLAEFGRPEGFLDRQLRRWRKQLDASLSRPLPGAEELHAALVDAVPASGPGCIVHGDYRLDNVMMGADDHVAAVLDWEMATLGDPLTDLGLFLVYWDGVNDIPGGVVTPVVTPGAGFPSGSELVARYAERRGTDLSRIDWYVAFGFFKLAVIAEGIYYRFAAGQTVCTGFDKIGDAVVPLITAGIAALARDAKTS
jgi:aminoglycoside phosphotransferase (APT) family kinase protein